MSAPYFYEPLITNHSNTYTLSEDTSKHCVQVLRMQEGDPLEITNGMGEIFEAVITLAHKKNTTVNITAHKTQSPLEQKIVLGISLLKNAVRLEWLFEKATEMGIHTIVPLICERTIHERFKMDRMQNILQSAMIQSKQVWLPNLPAPTALKSFIEQHKAKQQFIAHCEPGHKESIKAIEPGSDCIVLIGPEGDFTPSEIELAIKNNYQAIHLGNTRLRTETAGIFALSVLKKF